MKDKIEFAQIIASQFTEDEQVSAFRRQIDAFVSDGVEFLVSLAQSAGDARINGGWSWA